MLALAAEQAADRGWENTLAMVAAGVVIYLIWRVDLHLRSRNDKAKTHSPTPVGSRRRSVNQQVREVSDTDGINPDTTAGDWWGRIVTVGGARRRITGRLPEELVDGEVDLALEEPEAPAEMTLDDWVYDRLGQLSYSEIVAGGIRAIACSAGGRLSWGYVG